MADAPVPATAAGWMDRLWAGQAARAREYRFALRRFLGSPLAVVGGGIVALLLLVAMLAPLLSPFPGDAGAATHLAQRLRPPSRAHLLGTDDLGRDILSRVLMGSRLTLQIGFVVTVLSLVIGVPIGAVAGFLGGKADEVLMRTADVFQSIPPLILALAVAAALRPSMTNAMIAIAVAWWPWYSRVVRGQVLALRERTFVEAARCIGVRRRNIIFSHILPNCLSVILVQASLQVGNAILTAAALSFVGVGAQPPLPEWGLMLSVGRGFLPEIWWYVTFPGLAIFITVLGFNLLGDGLRDVLDPRLRR
jgi:peptide/nickel transport system permease protein